MKQILKTLTLLLALGASVPAHGVLLSSVNDNGNLFTEQSIGPGEIIFDIDWANILPVQLTLQVEAGDLQGDVLLQHVGIHPNDPGNLLSPPPGQAWSDYHLLLSGEAGFQGIGDVTAASTLSTPSNNQQTGSEINIFFDQPENAGVVILDQFLDLSDLSPGDTFTLTIMPTVSDAPLIPEPATASLLALTGGALLLRRRRTVGA